MELPRSRRLFYVIAFVLGCFLCFICTSRDTKSPVESRREDLPYKDLPWMKPHVQHSDGRPKKIFLDVGGNVASSVQMLREMYPAGKEFTVHSFELDSRMAPYFTPYPDHVLHCPIAASNKNGKMTAYAEAAWSPDLGTYHGKYVKWGGGTLFVDDAVKKDKAGGPQRMTRRHTVDTVDLSLWIQENTRLEDYVVLKMDIEGGEFDVLKKMLEDGTFKWIDKFYGEWHFGWPVAGWTLKKQRDLIAKLKKSTSIPTLLWEGEGRHYADFDAIQVLVPANVPGSPGAVISSCSGGDKSVTVAVQVGMNGKAAFKLVETIAAHGSNLPATLFVYGDFVEAYPNLVSDWAKRFTIGIRESQPFPPGHFAMMGSSWVRMSLVSALLRHREIGLQPSYYLPDVITDRVRDVARGRGLRIVQPTARFPPLNMATNEHVLTEENYYKFTDVMRVPRALRMLHEQLSPAGGVLTLDSDYPDSYLISGYLLDYLHESSGFDIVSLSDCIGE
ncbi:uncharacterized protein [Branchiostoma lanceolatum]|uniref:uncharacterized protein n=1 Tax=Branchiostoma lanceolatum TaxID=7740 RepID=UPI003456086B